MPRQVRRTSEGSSGECDALHRAASPHIVADHLAATTVLDDRDGLQFEVRPDILLNLSKCRSDHVQTSHPTPR